MLRAITDEQLHHGFKSGALIDLAPFATSSLPTPIVATTMLWRTLLWPYPSAKQSDHIDPTKLISDLQSHLFFYFRYSSPEPRLLTFVPNHQPTWLKPTIAIRVYLRHPDCMLLSLRGEAPPFNTHPLPCPAGLLVKLIHTIQRLSLFARSTDMPSVRKLLVLAQSRLPRHPLNRHIDPFVSNHDPNPFLPTDFTREEYRTLILDDLGLLIQLLLAYDPDPFAASSLACHYDALCSPLNELLHVTRSLLRFAAAVPHSSLSLSPFDQLLSSYSALRQLRDQDNPQIPERLVHDLRTNSYVLSKLLAPQHTEQLDALQQTLAILHSISRTFSAGSTYPPKFHLYH